MKEEKNRGEKITKKTKEEDRKERTEGTKKGGRRETKYKDEKK